MDVIVKFGDIWKLGDHLLLCGDSSEETMVEALLGRKKPRLMVTDPPYGESYTTFNRKDPRRKPIKEDQKKNLADIKLRNDHRTNQLVKVISFEPSTDCLRLAPICCS